MNTYSITSPSIGALLSDDNLYFEGIKRPLISFGLGENLNATATNAHENIAILERYFSDIHNLFLKKFADFSSSESTSNETTIKLQALLQEMIKVKGLIEAASGAVGDKTVM